MDSERAKPAMLCRAAASRGIVRAGPTGLAVPMERMEAMVSIAGSVLEAVQDEHRLAARAADVAAGTMGGAAGVWLSRADSGEVAWSTIGYGEMDTELAEVLTERVRTDLVTSGDTDRPILVHATDSYRPQWMQSSGVTTYSLFPIVAGGRLLGGLVIAWCTERPPLTAEDLSYARTLARLTGVTMFNARILADSAQGMEELRQHSELIEHMSDAVISCDPEGRVVSWNAGAERVYGYSYAEATGCDLFALLCTEFVATDGTPVSLEEALKAAESGGWQGESRERRSDGAALTTMASLTGRHDAEGHLEQLILVNRDITAQRHEEHEALHDPLTGLPNRRMLTLRLYDAYARACRHHQPLAVLFIDLDGFKPINDTYGHAAGDEVLKAVANRLSLIVRTSDTVARIGGDEFIVVLNETGSRASVTDVTRRILESVAEPVEVGTTSVQVYASIGVAHALEPTVDTAAEDLLDAADTAMYEAKRQRLGMVFAEEQPS